MTNIQTWIFQLVQVRSTLSHFSVKACGLVLHSWKCGLALFCTAALLKRSLLWRAWINSPKIWPNSYSQLNCTFGCPKIEDQNHILKNCAPLLTKTNTHKYVSMSNTDGTLGNKKKLSCSSSTFKKQDYIWRRISYLEETVARALASLVVFFFFNFAADLPLEWILKSK